MKKTFTLLFLIPAFGIIGCTVILKNNIKKIMLIHNDVEIPIKEEYWNDLTTIINASRLNIWTELPFGIRYDMAEPDYSVYIHYSNNKTDCASFWDGDYQFMLRGWRIIRKKDINKLYGILSSIREHQGINGSPADVSQNHK